MHIEYPGQCGLALHCQTKGCLLYCCTQNSQTSEGLGFTQSCRKMGTWERRSQKKLPCFFMSVYFTAPDYKLLCCTVAQLNSVEQMKR